ncbi:MAG: 4Fe-4S binding protein [Acetobacterium sp.]
MSYRNWCLECGRCYEFCPN